jgi:hypothetical protein
VHRRRVAELVEQWPHRAMELLLLLLEEAIVALFPVVSIF